MQESKIQEDKNEQTSDEFSYASNKGAVFLAKIPGAVYVVSFILGEIIAFVRQGFFYAKQLHEFNGSGRMIWNLILRVIIALLQGLFFGLLFVILLGSIYTIIKNLKRAKK